MNSRIAEHYNARPDKGREQRKDSVIFHMKSFNNWVKSVLIDKFTKPRAVVLDLCCGKGGDLLKWNKALVTEVVGLDIASVSVDQASARFHQGRNLRFKASFHAVDCFSAEVMHLLNGRTFDLISVQFALHYAFESEGKFRQAMQNISSHLKPGGIIIGTIPNANWIYKKMVTEGLSFGNSIYRITFESAEPRLFGHKYQFELADAIDDCPEYLINHCTFKK